MLMWSTRNALVAARTAPSSAARWGAILRRLLAWAQRAEVGVREAALAPLGNSAARLTPGALRRIFGRFCDAPEIREARLARDDLPASLRADLALATAKALAAFAAAAGWLDKKRA